MTDFHAEPLTTRKVANLVHIVGVGADQAFA
jgi:hypothetical protein